MGSADLGDGVWIWPEGLAHYVARHEIRLPNEFVEHARANGFRIPEVELQGDAIEDTSFWSDWCGANTNGDADAQALWRRAPDEIEAADNDIYEKLIEKHGGLADKICMWAGCENQALKGLVFCPACAHQKMNAWP
ncbi:MAG: hypothetical protein JRE13_14765 [Deltaproteobacteria bacterium]|nr:hypothetical protein [Deltaproteobacteria bacterium]